jgi:hypothetical protein
MFWPVVPMHTKLNKRVHANYKIPETEEFLTNSMEQSPS